jgi:hypothetical protein
MEECKSPLDVFVRMFGEDNLELLLEESNIQRAAVRKQMPVVTMAELRKTIGILMYMGVVSLPNVHLYWRKSMGITAVSQVCLESIFIVDVQHVTQHVIVHVNVLLKYCSAL